MAISALELVTSTWKHKEISIESTKFGEHLGLNHCFLANIYAFRMIFMDFHDLASSHASRLDSEPSAQPPCKGFGDGDLHILHGHLHDPRNRLTVLNRHLPRAKPLLFTSASE